VIFRQNVRVGKLDLKRILLIAELFIYFFREEVSFGMGLGRLKKSLMRTPILRFFGAKWDSRDKKGLSRRVTGGVEMNEVEVLRGAEPRKILQTVIEKKVPAIMSYLSRGKWHVAKLLVTELGACRLNMQLMAARKPHPINIQPGQPVGISLKYGYGKFIFETKVVALEPATDATSGGTIILEVPSRIEIVQRRSYFRVDVPASLKVKVLLWHRRQQESRPESENAGLETGVNDQAAPGRCFQGRLADISAGGAQVALDISQKEEFKNGQFVGIRFTPMPYERPLVFNAQIRNILPTVDSKNICLGLQIVGLEASLEGREVLQRLCSVVERYYKINQSGVKQQDFQGASARI